MIDRKEDNQFHLVSKYEPSGDQPQAIETLVDNIKGGEKAQILKGATGTGKTYTMSQVIQRVNKPTLVIAHNKTLAGQLYGEFKEFFPDNAVEYFVSYYDYYQPEAYVPSSDTYIEKDSSINDEIDKLRHSATSALLERNDVIVVASVSCIYGLGSPKEYADSAVSLRPGQEISRDKLLNDLVDIQFERNDIDFQRGKFRVRGDVVEIFPASRDENAFRVEFFGDEIDRICEIESLTGRNLGEVEHLVLFPATHFMTNEEHMKKLSRILWKRWRFRLINLKPRVNSSRLNVFVNGQNTMSKCFVRWVTPMVSKTTHVTWMVVKKVSHRLLYLISSQKISSS